MSTFIIQPKPKAPHMEMCEYDGDTFLVCRCAERRLLGEMRGGRGW